MAATQVETGGKLNQSGEANVAGSYVYVISANAYDLTGKAVQIQTVQLPALTAGVQASLIEQIDANNQVVIGFRDNTLYAECRIAGSITDSYNIPWPNTPPVRALKLTFEASGKVFWDYSQDGVNFIQLYSRDWPFAITSLWSVIQTGTYAANAAPGTAQWDNWNIPLALVTLTGTSPGKATTTASPSRRRPLTASAPGAATVSVQLGRKRPLTGTSPGVATASGAATVNRGLTGTVIAQATFAATMSMLNGITVGQGSSAAGLTLGLAGTTVGQAQTTLSTPTISLPLPSTVAVAQAASTAGPTIFFQGASVGQATASGPLTPRLTGTTIAQAQTSVSAVQQANFLSGTTVAQAATSNALALSLGNQTVVAQASFFASMSALNGTVATQASSTAALTLRLAGTTVAQAATSMGTAYIAQPLAGVTVAQASPTAALSLALQGASVAQASSTGAPTFRLQGATAAQATVSLTTAAIGLAPSVVVAQAQVSLTVLSLGLAPSVIVAQAQTSNALRLVLGVQAVVGQGSTTVSNVQNGTFFSGITVGQASTSNALRLSLAPVAVVGQGSTLIPVLGINSPVTGATVAQAQVSLTVLSLALQGSTVAQADVSGPLVEWISGSITTQAQSSAALSLRLTVGYPAGGQATTSLAGLLISLPLVGATVAQATVAVPNPLVGYALSGAALGQASTSVTALALRMALSGAVQTQASVTLQALSLALQPTTVVARATSDVVLTLGQDIGTGILAQATVRNFLFVGWSGQTSAQGSSAATLTLGVKLQGDIQGQAQSAAPLRLNLVGSSLGQAQSTGDVFVQAGVTFAGTSVGRASAEITELRLALSGSIATQASAAVGLRLEWPAVSALGHATSSATATPIWQIQGQVQGQATFAARPPDLAWAQGSAGVLAQASSTALLALRLPVGAIQGQGSTEIEAVIVYRFFVGAAVGQASSEATLYIQRFAGTQDDDQLITTGPSVTRGGGRGPRTYGGSNRSVTRGLPYGSRTRVGGSGKVTWGNQSDRPPPPLPDNG